MSKLYIPEDYTPVLGLKETQVAIKKVKDFFQLQLAAQLNLKRVSAPLFVSPESGLNDNLNGVERPVSFGVLEQDDAPFEIVHSLAKWKRLALKRYKFDMEEGLYTDMSAIRRDEETDNIHSVYVDQWDWEKIIAEEDRTVEKFQTVVKSIYDALRVTEKHIQNHYEYIHPILPEKITFITSQELVDMYPGLSAKEREYEIVKEKGAVCLMQIGDILSNGEKHDGRAPDYDDWALNGDILVYYPVLDIALELSSMGIRVNAQSMKEQLKKAGCEERAELPFHKALINGELPQTIGGGIGQSRICMFFLRKCHIGEVQVSVWPEEIYEKAAEKGITIL
ncbi:MAG: aspartate--ammonia ligase [Lachnospiraceae bacterium]|nr:aspartate--ammonia ligase [Lachnospiraceae bacterium]